MKILVISPNFPPAPGGVAIFVANLCRQLNRLGHTVDVLATERPGHVEWDCLQPYRIYRYDAGRFRPSSLVPLMLILRLYWQRRYDAILLGQFIYTHALGALVLKKALGLPYAILSHGNDLCYPVVTTKLDRAVTPTMLNNASMVLANSRHTEQLARRKGYAGVTALLNPGVDTAQFHPEAGTTDVADRYGLNGDRIIITTARLTFRKNVHGVLQALPAVLRNVPRLRYLIVGAGPEEPELRAISRSLGLEHVVQFLGYLDNVLLPPLYCAADVLAMPSYDLGEGDAETFGISYLEANACGKPAIGGRAGGAGDAIVDGVTGLLVNPHSVDEIATGLNRLLSNRKMAVEMGNNGRLRVLQEFDWDRVGERLAGHLTSMVAGT